ncbi:TetR/AcrR family transcriptional regulator [Chitinimonas naiadis]
MRHASTRTMTEGTIASARILDAAEQLFYQEGVRAVGVDAVVKQAGVNKMSLYRQFSSKDELLKQYLLRRDEKFWATFNRSTDQHPDDPAAALLQIFTDLASRTQVAGYRGCPFVNLAAEFSDPDHFVRKMIAENKQRLLERLIALATAAGVPSPLPLAQALALLIEGAYTASQTYSPGNAVLCVLPSVAQSLLAQALNP